MEENREKKDKNDSLRYYKDMYETERLKGKTLEEKLVKEQELVANTEHKLSRIKGSVFWKYSKPLRSFVHWAHRTKERIGNYGSIRGFARKVDSKLIEKKAKIQHGSAGFPTPEEAEKQRETVFPKNIKISILIPLYNTPENFLTQAIDSVLAQTYENWELCLADGSDNLHGYVESICREYMEDDSLYLDAHPELAGRIGSKGRILYERLEKNEGISGNTNRALAMASGDYIGLFDHDDILHPSILFEYMKAICEQGADYIYCDEATFHGDSIDNMITLHFKPDFAIDNLRANNYICHFSVFDRKLLEGTELFRSRFDGSQDHDMILRLTDRARNVVHIPKLMYYWRSHKGSVASDINAKSYAIDAAKGAVAQHLKSKGFENFEITSTRAFETIFRIRYELQGEPKITIVIPNKDHLEDLKRCITSILEMSSYDNYDIVIVENNSKTGEIFEYYEELSKNPRISVIDYEGGFNYSRINNLGVSKADGEYIILLNNDTEVITLNWMEELLMYAQREDVGAVGCKLYYEDKTIQHAGVVIGLGAHRTAGHTHYRVSRNNLGYMGRLCYAQNVSAVTGACLMVKKELYEKVGGLDETFEVSLNDVDFCLRLREAGYLNVFTPFAQLYHYESISRGSDSEGKNAARYDEESERFRKKWRKVLEKGDPYYNINFSLDRSDFALKING
ncbi:MAG: glycosyltransferase family 2 protein [Lachnospiraceae bacterium]|nr:glycosyltransferase family 2 protein [Lachnospiraceae bacterium]